MTFDNKLEYMFHVLKDLDRSEKRVLEKSAFLNFSQLKSVAIMTIEKIREKSASSGCEFSDESIWLITRLYAVCGFQNGKMPFGEALKKHGGSLAESNLVHYANKEVFKQKKTMDEFVRKVYRLKKKDANINVKQLITDIMSINKYNATSERERKSEKTQMNWVRDFYNE